MYQLIANTIQYIYSKCDTSNLVYGWYDSECTSACENLCTVKSMAEWILQKYLKHAENLTCKDEI